MKKRIFALALSLIMALSLLSAPAMASNYDILQEALEYLEVHQDEVSQRLTNDTDEEGLARLVLAVLKPVMPEDMDMDATATFYYDAGMRKNATTTAKGWLTAQIVLHMDGDSYDWIFMFDIPVAPESQGEIDGMEADKAAIAAAFADYFATAKVDESNILQQKKNLQGIMDKTVKNCSEAKFLNGGEGFSTSIKNGYSRATYRLVLGGQTQEVKLDATIHTDGSVTINSLGNDNHEVEPEPETEYTLADLADPRYMNIGPSEVNKMYRDGEQFVLMVCTSDCGWCRQMKKGLPATLSDANYAIYGTNDDLGEISFYWNYTPFNSLGTPILVLVNGKDDVEVVGSVRNQEMMADVLQKARDRGIPSADGAVQTTPAPTETTVPAIPATGTAYPSTQAVDLDGKKVEFQMYALKDDKGNSTNYVKVRDLALAIDGSMAQFNVSWDGAVNLVSGSFYIANGSENSTPFSGERTYTVPTSPTNVNGAPSDLQAIVLTDDAGGGFTYYQLRDLGRKLGFNVGWSAEKGVFIETYKPYSEK